MVLSAIFFSLTVSVPQFWPWLILTVLCWIALWKEIYYLLGSIVIWLATLCALQIWHQQPLHLWVKTETHVVTTTALGPIVKFEQMRVLLKSKQASLYQTGDRLFVEGRVVKVQSQEQTFPLQTYLKAFQTVNYIADPQIRIVQRASNLRTKLIAYIKRGPVQYQRLTLLVLLGVRNESTKSLYEMTKQLNIVHLFVISGLHFHLLATAFNKILTRCKVHVNYRSIIIFSCLLVYLTMLHFPLAATRAFLFLGALEINRRWFKKHFSNFDLLALIMAGHFIFNPWIIYSWAFILTFSTTFMLLYVAQIKIKKRWKKWFLMMSSAYFSSTLIIVHFTAHFVVFGFLYNLVYSPIMVVVYSAVFILWPCYYCMNGAALVLDFLLTIFLQSALNFKITFINLPLTLISYIILITCILFMEQKSIWLQEKHGQLFKNGAWNR